MRLLDVYIFRKLYLPFLLTLCILTFILIIPQSAVIVEWVVGRGAGLQVAGSVFLSLLPPFFEITLPVASLLATVVVFRQLSFYHEVTAMQASGVGHMRILRPVFFSHLSWLALLFGWVTLPL